MRASYPQSTLDPIGWHSGASPSFWLICLDTLSQRPDQSKIWSESLSSYFTILPLFHRSGVWGNMDSDDTNLGTKRTYADQLFARIHIFYFSTCLVWANVVESDKIRIMMGANIMMRWQQQTAVTLNTVPASYSMVPCFPHV